MTTIAYDGYDLACDSLGVDPWNTRETTDKVYIGEGFLIGCAGPYAKIIKWYRSLDKALTYDELVKTGYPTWDHEKDGPGIILVNRSTGAFTRNMCEIFIPASYPYWAIGSGRDYALAAMRLGKTAEEAIEVAKFFDNDTGGDTHVYETRRKK
jgi:ATP-dependent protease HslVU (ClpYQ) peptidase subunit